MFLKLLRSGSTPTNPHTTPFTHNIVGESPAQNSLYTIVLHHTMACKGTAVCELGVFAVCLDPQSACRPRQAAAVLLMGSQKTGTVAFPPGSRLGLNQ